MEKVIIKCFKTPVAKYFYDRHLDTVVAVNDEEYETLKEIEKTGTGFVEDKYRLEELQRESKIYCDVDFEKCINMADAIVFADNTMRHDYNGLQNFCLRKYNTEVNNFIMSRQFFKVDHEWRKIQYYTVMDRKQFQHKSIEIPNFFISNIEDDVRIEKQIVQILDKFKNNFFVI